MKILVAPLNWGLGHASRCVPLVRRFIKEGHEVILGGNGDSLTLLRRHFPKLRYVYLAPLNLRYSAGKRQVWAMLKALPQLLRWAVQDHTLLKAVLNEEPIDRVVSDNRFGLYVSDSKAGQTQCVYMTHQLHVMLPKGWQWAEPMVERLHAWVYGHYHQVWVPDYEEAGRSLAGELSHPGTLKKKNESKIQYIGPLSRFSPVPASPQSSASYDVVAVLSGLEPHRTMLEKEIIGRYQGADERVLVIQGLPGRPNTRFKRGNITMVPYMGDEELAKALRGARHIIARSGYSTIMDMEALGLLKQNAQKEKSQISNLKSQIELIPTPGQPEQEYLARLLCKK